MTSKIKVDNINKVSDDSTIIKKCGTTTTVGSGSGQTIVIDGATVTLGRCGGAVNLAPGATQTGFGRTGTVDWCTTAKTSPLTVASGNGYFINTTGGAVTVTLPASPSAGDIISLKDYAGTFQTNNVTVGRNSSKINGVCSDATLDTQGDSITLVYVDGTKGWINVQTDDTVTGSLHVVATGGTITESGDFKIHTFNSSSSFVVTDAGKPGGSTTVDYLVLGAGGGGASGGGAAGGGGAGGHRFSFPNPATGGFPISVQSYPITVGGGGAGGVFGPGPLDGTPGGLSTFSTITSAGGGGGIENGPVPAGNGGSGGGGSYQTTCGGSGNTPPVSPPQGNNGGTGQIIASFNTAAGGGGGAGAVGVPGPSGVSSRAGTGGCGVANSITGSAVTRGGGGNAYGQTGPSGTLVYAPTPSPGGGGASPAGAGGTNLGGGGGGNATGDGGLGGSGVVIIRYKFQ